ncbi:diguanylate cyclase (GGDEF)-like protein [Arthrobacter ginsengisoli]|uniref:Diguanylate cyclase (GGDEF)-like protein n=1 Tax=Arthrobacter ginsengisoli TaxID=1356565 RepID=A0ABU1UBA7_9MICC|nr:EAL domain-containing protein [Arthrobacter ginsengisoli]MDR7082430.1 diguanylate cyclase (GGDEF)-like protein [Arthrobacter ginsengisoli]
MMTACGLVTNGVDDDCGAPSTDSAMDGEPNRSRNGGRQAPDNGPADLSAVPAAAGALAIAPTRTWSLQREWSWAFLLMFLAVLLGAAATFIGVRGVMNEVHAAASRLHTEAGIVADLRAALDAHEQAGLLLLAGAPSDQPAYIQQQQELSELFEKASTVLPAEMTMRADVVEARRAWQQNLTTHGLQADQMQAPGVDRLSEAPGFTAAGARIRGQLDHIERSSLESLDAGLASSARLEQLVIVARSTLFCLTAAAVLYFRRRMIKYLMQPLESLRRGVAELRTGDYRHRIDVVRHDELGELAQAFNSLAAAVHGSHAELTHRATHDPLTGLANRAALTDHLAAAFGPGSDHQARHAGLLFIDVDDFKDVNDSLGHDSGDLLLVRLAARLTSCVRPNDLVARLGGDEFAIVVMDQKESSGTAAVAARIHQALRAPFHVGEDRLMVTVSMGAAQQRPGTQDPSTLLREADFAMYMAKHSGKDRYQLFDAEGYDHMAYRAALKADLAVATPAGQLRIEYQPVANLDTGAIVGVEALVRWHHPTLGVLAPSEFITLAEDTGDIDAIGAWVLETATQQAAAWRRNLPGCADLWIAVNLSTFQLREPRNLDSINRILSDPATQADKVVLEVTETALASNVDGGITALKTLKALGVRIAIDDFGTGFSSLSTLAALPVDILKIDRSFLSSQQGSAPSTAMLEGILGLAHKLSLDVIAEGIEETEQLHLLRSLGCTMGQGYHLSRPGPAQKIEALLASPARFQPAPDSELEDAIRS